MMMIDCMMMAAAIASPFVGAIGIVLAERQHERDSRRWRELFNK